MKTVCVLPPWNYLRKISLKLKSCWTSGKKNYLPHLPVEVPPEVGLVVRLEALRADLSVKMEGF